MSRHQLFINVPDTGSLANLYHFRNTGEYWCRRHLGSFTFNDIPMVCFPQRTDVRDNGCRNWRRSNDYASLIQLLYIAFRLAHLLYHNWSQIGQSALGESEEQEDGSTSLTFRDALRTRQFWLISGVYLMMGACLQSILVHIVPHATDVGITEVTAASIISVIGGVSIISKVAVGMAVDRLGNKPVALMITSFMLISLLIIQLSDALWVLYVFAVFFAFGYGGFAAIQSPYLAELFGLKYHGTIFGFALFIMGAGAFGPFVAGKIFDATSSYNLAFVMLAVLSFVAIVLASGIKKTDRTSPVRKN
jgi:predicted MFS family arabinose efflux permease